MPKYAKLIFTLILLVLFIFQANRWQGRLFASALTYRSFLTDTLLLPGDSLTPQVSRVVLVIIGGLGYDAMQTFDLPTLERLRESGASALMQSQPPSYTEPAWLALLSGIQPAFNNGARFNRQTEADNGPMNIETIFHSAQHHGIGTALAGSIRWRSVVPPSLLDTSVFTSFEGTEGDQQIIDSLGPMIDNEDLGLILVYFNQIDYAGYNSGGIASETYEKAIQQVDDHFNTLLDMLDLARTTLIITSDRGHIDQGGNGGHDLAVLQQPFIMAGRGVIPGTYSPIEQVDIAPTVAMLLGLNLPPGNQGRPLVEMISISERDRANALLNLAKQRILLTGAYLNALGAPLPDTSAIERAEDFFANNNYAGAAELAQLLVDQTDQAALRAKTVRLGQEQRQRFLLVFGLILGLIIFTLWRRTELWSYALLAALVGLATYHGLYWLADQPYSFSAITSMEQVWYDTLPRVALSLLAGLLFYIALLILQQYTKIDIVLISSYEFVFFFAWGFLMPALYGFWRYGLTITWFFPDMATLFLHLTGLIQGVWAIFLGVFSPFFIIPLNLLMQKWVAAYQRRQIMKLRARSTQS